MIIFPISKQKHSFLLNKVNVFLYGFSEHGTIVLIPSSIPEGKTEVLLIEIYVLFNISFILSAILFS